MTNMLSNRSFFFAVIAVCCMADLLASVFAYVRIAALNSVNDFVLSICVCTTMNGLYSSGRPLRSIAFTRLLVMFSPAAFNPVAAHSALIT